MIVDIETLRIMLTEVPANLENKTQGETVFREVEFKNLLSQKLNIFSRDQTLVIYFLKKFKFIKQVKRGRQVFYMIKSLNDPKQEEYELSKKLLEVNLTQMKFKEGLMIRDINRIKQSAKEVRAVNKAKFQNLLVELKSKLKTLQGLKGKILLLGNQINQLKTIRSDVEMAKVLAQSNKMLEGSDDVMHVIQNTVAMGNHVTEMQGEINNIVVSNTGDMDNDEINMMFNDLDAGISQIGVKIIEEEVDVKHGNSIKEEPNMVVKKPVTAETDKLVLNPIETSNDKLKMSMDNVGNNQRMFGIDDVKEYMKAKEGTEKQVIVEEREELVLENQWNRGNRNETTWANRNAEQVNLNLNHHNIY